MTPRLLIAGMSVILLSGCTSKTSTVRAAPPEGPNVVEATAADSVDPIPPAPTLAAATTQPTAPTLTAATTQLTRPPATPVEATANEATAQSPPATTLIDRFDAQLLALTKNDAADADAFASLPADERALLDAIIDSLGRFRTALGDPRGLLADKAAPMIHLAEELNAQAPLSLPMVALCRSVTQFGVYDPIDPPRFTAGTETRTIVYCEVDHFRSNRASEGRYQTKLTYEAVLYSDSDHAVSIITRKPAQIVDFCRNRRRDFFLADRLTLPASLPVGRYLLKVTVVDELANRVAEKTLPIVVAPR